MDELRQRPTDENQQFPELELFLQNPECRRFADQLLEAATPSVNYGGWSEEINKKMDERFETIRLEMLQSKLCQSSPEAYFSAVHRLVSISTIGAMIKFLSPTDVSEIISQFESDLSAEREFSGNLEAVSAHTEGLSFWFGMLAQFGFDGAIGDITKSPLNPPFKEIDFTSPVWQKDFEVSENFCHAINKLFLLHNYIFSIKYIVKNLECGAFDRAKKNLDNLKFYATSIPATLSILRHFQKSLTQNEDERGTLNAEDLANGVKDLLIMRMHGSYAMKESLPVKFNNKTESLTFENVDQDALMIAVYEIAKNAFKGDKVSKGDMEGYRDRGEPYLTVNMGEVVMNGKDAIAIEITDKGNPIDVHGVIDRMGDQLKGWKSRDITFGQMLAVLSQRHISVPLKKADGSAGTTSTGIGLHVARDIIRAHNGEMFPVNLKDRGVSFLIIIPKEGKAADWSVSEEKVTGAQCGEISEKITAAQMDFRQAILDVMGQASCDLPPSAIVGPQSESSYALT